MGWTLRSVHVFGLATLLALASQGLGIVSAAGAVGSLLVESDPAGAAVYVDGRLAGETPLTLPTIAAGVHRVRLVRLGYLQNSRVVTVKAGSRATVRARLTDPAPQSAQAAALKIVVIEGEGAVNIIQQKTAVAPIVEVRDRNDQPVSGVVVRFVIQKGRASFNGARTLSVTTNAAGRATATGLTATGRGALQITASATFQGQTAAVAISQTSVATAAQAAGASAAGSGGAAGGGGLSHTAIAGIVGGAGIAGAVIARKTLSVQSTAYSGTFSGELISTQTITPSPSPPCVRTFAMSGTLTITLNEGEGTVSGTAQLNGTRAEIAIAPSTCIPGSGTQPFNFNGPVTGTAASLAFSQQVSGSGASTTSTSSLTFSGALNGGVISGTMTYSETIQGTQTSPIPAVISGGGTTTFPVTLR